MAGEELGANAILLSGWLYKKAQNSKLVRTCCSSRRMAAASCAHTCLFRGTHALLQVTRKYQKRWFELTEDSLAYAKDPDEEAGCKIELFNLTECAWLKRLDDTKFEVRALVQGLRAPQVEAQPRKPHTLRTLCVLQVKFPERSLRLKAETPGDASRWIGEIQGLLQLHHEREATSTSGPLCSPRAPSSSYSPPASTKVWLCTCSLFQCGKALCA